MTSCMLKMADTFTSDGFAGIAPSDAKEDPAHERSLQLADYDGHRLPDPFSSHSSHPQGDWLTGPAHSPAPSAKRVTMDGDLDGAPTHTLPSVMTSSTLSDGGGHSPRTRLKENGSADGGSHDSGSGGSKTTSSAESTPRRSTGRAKSANPPTSGRDKVVDMTAVDMKTSWDGSMTGSMVASKGEMVVNSHCDRGGGVDGDVVDGPSGEGVVRGYTTLKYRAGMLADPVKIAKEREKEERVRQAREKLDEERRKKLMELKEQQRLAQENRDKQLEMRRQKIEDLRRRDTERRAAVEERRRMKEEIERIRRESILQKAEERVARYEAWKAGGRKGGRGHVLGFGSGAPRDICQPLERPRRSSSHSALHRRSPNGSDIDSTRPQRRAVSACSAVRRHCCVDVNRMGMFGIEGGSSKRLSMSTSVLYHKRNPDFSSATTLSSAATSSSTAVYRPDSSMGLNTIREGGRSVVGLELGASSTPHLHPPGSSSLSPSPWSPVRMRDRNTPRKPRPSSVASSMPSFVGAEPAKSPRSKSTDRSSRDRSKNRIGRKEAKSPKDNKANDIKVNDDHKEDNKDDNDGTTKKNRVSLSFFDRLSTPKFARGDQPKEPALPKKEAPLIRIISAEEDGSGKEDAFGDGRDGTRNTALVKLSPRKAYSTTNLAAIKKKSSLKEKPTTTRDPPPLTKPTQTVTVREPRGPSPKVGGPSAVSSPSVKSTSSPRRTPPPPSHSSPQHGTPTAPPASQGTPSTASQAVGSEDGTTGPRGVNADITEVAYKAKMAEKRKQAREKAEREAEEERQRQEEARLLEEERLKQEEEEQKRMEEESERLAKEAREAEEERLQKAIEAEDKRKKEEADRLEQERKAKEEAERKAKEEAERLDREKQERSRKEEEERQQRKKKLEMIMKRVKTDPAQDSNQPHKADSPTKSVGNSPNRSAVSSPDVMDRPPFPQTTDATPANPLSSSSSSSPDDAEPAESQPPTTTPAGLTDADGDENADVPVANLVTRSASSGDILDGASAHEEAKERQKEAVAMTTSTSDVTSSMGSSDGQGGNQTPNSESKSRFKSPLLQHLVENKGGDPSSPGTPKFKSPLLQNLLGKTKVGARMGMSSSMSDLSVNNKEGSGSTSSSPRSSSPFSSSKEISKQGGDDEDKDKDESQGGSVGGGDGLHLFNSSPSLSPSNGLSNGMRELAGGDSSASSPQETKVSPSGSGMGDSALGASIGPSGMIQSLSLANGHSGNDMQDSSISLHSVDGETTSASHQSFDHQTVEELPLTIGQDGGQFEELIDLELLDTTSGVKATSPIIAFEENKRMTDVSESLS